MPFSVSTDQFEELVLESSKTQPVVVDFWAPWCEPCRQLTPILEELEKEAGGKWFLAKANVEEHPQLGQVFQIQGIPALKAFVGGQIVAQTQGLASKEELKAWLAGFVPGEEAELVASGRAAEAAGDHEKAEADFRAALELKPGYEEATVGLAAVLEATGRLEEASELVESLDGAVAARIRLERESADGPNLEDARAAAKGGGMAERHALAIAEAKAGHHEAAIELLLELIAEDKGWNEQAARKSLLEVFQLAGNDSELVDDARRRLAMLLF